MARFGYKKYLQELEAAESIDQISIPFWFDEGLPVGENRNDVVHMIAEETPYRTHFLL